MAISGNAIRNAIVDRRRKKPPRPARLPARLTGMSRAMASAILVNLLSRRLPLGPRACGASNDLTSVPKRVHPLGWRHAKMPHHLCGDARNLRNCLYSGTPSKGGGLAFREL